MILLGFNETIQHNLAKTIIYYQSELLLLQSTAQLVKHGAKLAKATGFMQVDAMIRLHAPFQLACQFALGLKIR